MTTNEPDNAFDASDPSKIAQRVSRAKRREAERLDGLRQTMDTPNGRHFMWELLAQCGIFKGSFVPDGLVLAFQMGQRNVGLPLLVDIQNNFNTQYMKMVSEAQENSK